MGHEVKVALWIEPQSVVPQADMVQVMRSCSMASPRALNAPPGISSAQSAGDSTGRSPQALVGPSNRRDQTDSPLAEGWPEAGASDCSTADGLTQRPSREVTDLVMIDDLEGTPPTCTCTYHVGRTLLPRRMGYLALQRSPLARPWGVLETEQPCRLVRQPRLLRSTRASPESAPAQGGDFYRLSMLCRPANRERGTHVLCRYPSYRGGVRTGSSRGGVVKRQKRLTRVRPLPLPMACGRASGKT